MHPPRSPSPKRVNEVEPPASPFIPVETTNQTRYGGDNNNPSAAPALIFFGAQAHHMNTQ
eukprot:7450519-Ditylum_brightwellii.AAC.1